MWVAAQVGAPGDFGPFVSEQSMVFGRLTGGTVADDAPPLAGSGSLSSLAPSPVADRATARLVLTAPADVRARVIDALGRSVAVVFDGRLPAGTHALAVDASSLAPGAYVLRAEGEGVRATRRFSVAR